MSSTVSRRICRPVAVPPVKEMPLMSGWRTRAEPVGFPAPYTKFITPGGSPTSWNTAERTGYLSGRSGLLAVKGVYHIR